MVVTPSLRAWFILGATLIIYLLLNIDCSAANLILVEISQGFDEDLRTLQWVLSGYTLTWGAFSLLGFLFLGYVPPYTALLGAPGF